MKIIDGQELPEVGDVRFNKYLGKSKADIDQLFDVQDER